MFVTFAPQTRGHHIADLDPLGINQADLDATVAPELQLSTYRFGNELLIPVFLNPPNIAVVTLLVNTCFCLSGAVRELLSQGRHGVCFIYLNMAIKSLKRQILVLRACYNP